MSEGREDRILARVLAKELSMSELHQAAGGRRRASCIESTSSQPTASFPTKIANDPFLPDDDVESNGGEGDD
ncbi:MAG TPA: hypothetical protein VGG33_22225 [Polyangia bacterium]